MDHIYPAKDYKEYEVKKDVEMLYQKINEAGMPQTVEDISNQLGIDMEELNERTQELCKIYEDYGDYKPSNAEGVFESFHEEALELNVVQYLKKHELNINDEQKVHKNQLKRVKHFVESKKSNYESGDIDPLTECILTVRFYFPFKYTPSTKNNPRFHQEYHALGSNFLSELRDKFYCQCNFGPFFDISNNPLEENMIDPTEHKPGFFFIHDTFYNDTRTKEGQEVIDYSDVILDFFKKYDYVRKFKKATLQDTKFEDLRIRIGYPYVYQHHGLCEHVFCITSIDLIDNTNSLTRSDYPKLVSKCNSRPMLCDVCSKIEVSYLVTDCPEHVKDHMYLCPTCFFSFHYLNRETKTCEFKAYRIYSAVPSSSVIQPATETVEKDECQSSNS